MTKSMWENILNGMDVDTSMCDISPADQKQLDDFEIQSGVKLPQSYRTFCTVFGAGELSECYRITVPGYSGEAAFVDLHNLNSEMHVGLEWEEYSPDPKQFQRAIIFANDVARNIYFWDPSELTDAATSEYGFYVKHEDWETKRLADTFWDLVNEVWLGERHVELFNDEPQHCFQPAM